MLAGCGCWCGGAKDAAKDVWMFWGGLRCLVCLCVCVCVVGMGGELNDGWGVGEGEGGKRREGGLV